MTKTTWRYKNETTGNEMICDDMRFFMSRVKEVKGVPFTDSNFADILLYKKTRLTVTADDGTAHEILIEELEEESESQ